MEDHDGYRILRGRQLRHPSFGTIVDGKTMSCHYNHINVIAGCLGFKSTESYCSHYLEDVHPMMVESIDLEDKFELPPDAEETIKTLPPEQLYDVEHGLDCRSKLVTIFEQIQML